MGPYHIVLTHFPIALWTLAMAVILLRVLSAGPLARRLDQALVPLLTVALLFGLAAYATGTQVWDWESISASPLGRNHLMLAAWTVALWAVVWWLRWRRGEAVWEGGMRWAMAALALLGAVLLAITGTLGGHLMSAPTDLSKLLRHLGWEPLVLRDVPGLAVARTIAMLVNEGADAVWQGVCDEAGADTAMKLGVNYPAGPFEWLAQLGAPTVVELLDGLFAAYRSERYRVSPLLQQLSWR